ncbi:MAG: COX15/CtaA family protein [Deltaproteobacteria bacterium]|nr:COX15/CtaA family protein [Deltaproteobacteria bacterium]
MSRVHPRFRSLSTLSLVVTLGVILWGAYVRASGSGAGCGSHWPTCNGEVIPRSPSSATLVELTHRVTSGLSALLVLGQLVWARRLFPVDHPVRSPVRWAALFMFGEVLIGAGIVILKYVAMDQSFGRAVWVALHLVNTFLLVGSLGLVAWRSAGARRFDLEGKGLTVGLGVVCVALILATGATGAIAALGDTLFPAKSLGSALREDFSPASHWLVQLRVVHPFLAVMTAFVLLAVRQVVDSRADSREVSYAGTQLRVSVVCQVALGFVNMLMLAPTWMQLAHLLVSQYVWLALVRFFATALEAAPTDLYEALGIEPTEAEIAEGGSLTVRGLEAADAGDAPVEGLPSHE